MFINILVVDFNLYLADSIKIVVTTHVTNGQ
jgi:hypothetical protein